MEYNELFETEEQCKKTLGVLFNFKLGNVPIKVYNVEIIEPAFSFFDCMKYEIPYSYTIKYTIGLENGDLMTTDTLMVPKMKDGSFLIEGTESVGGVAVRTPINLIKIDRPIGVFTRGKMMTISAGNFWFKIEKASMPNATIMIKMGPEKDAEQKFYSLGSYFKNNDLPIKSGDVELSVNKDDPTDYPIIKTDKRTYDKMFYLFGYELKKDPQAVDNDQNPYILSPKDIWNIWNLANTNFYKIDKITPFDLNFGDSSSSIMKHFKHNLRMRTQVFGKWNRSQNKATKIYTDPVQKYVDAYFRMQSESAKDLQVANDTNALDQLSQQRKCYFARTDGDKIPIAVDADYVGVIDPGKTHEGGSTSKRNELARGIRVDENGLRIRLVDARTNETVWVDLLTHYKSSILATDCWDYDDNKLLVNKNGKIQILQRGKYSYVDPDFKYDYRRYYRDDILGYGDSAIPMMNATDHTRIALGTAQLDQAIPTEGCTPPIVATGVEKTIYEISNLNIKSKENGVVENITKDYVKISNDKGGFSVYQIPNPISSTAHTNQFFFPVVKVGDHVKKDQIIIEINSFRHGQLALSTPLKIAYMDYELGTFEDSTILSESAAKKLGHKSLTTIDIPIVASTEYVYGKEQLSFRSEFSGLEASEFQYLNDLCLPDIGDKVESGQLLFAYLYESEGDMEKVMRLRRLISPETKIYAKAIKRVPRNILNGVIRDIHVTVKNRNYPIVNDISDYYKKVHDQQEKDQIKDIGYAVPHVDKAKYLRQDQIAMISIDIEYINMTKIGDKVSNRFGTKGLIKLILPDDQMPKLPNGEPVEMIVGPESVMSRKNIAQIYEIALGMASVELWKKSKEVIESQNMSEDAKRKYLVEVLNTIHVTDRYTNKTYKELLDEFHAFDGFYQIKVPALDSKYMNEKVMGSILKLAGLPSDGKFIMTIGKRKTTNPVVCGISSIERLEFIAELKSKSTSSKGGNKNNDLAIGTGGKIKSSGQRLGNQEIYALQAYGTMELLEHLRQEEPSHGKDIQQELNTLGLSLVAIDEY